MSFAAQLLDELMGRNRDLAPDEKDVVKASWWDPDVCKYYLCGFCPHDLFTNTRADLGYCNKVHDDELRRVYNKSSRYFKMGYEDDFLSYLQNLVGDVDKRIERGHQRLQLNQMAANMQGTPQNANQEKTRLLSEKINDLVEQAEKLGCEGKVEEAQGVMKLCDQLKEERHLLQESVVNQLQPKEMEVCPTCGALLVVGDAPQRVEDHLNGKQHVGYSLCRTTIEDLKKKLHGDDSEREARLQREREEREKEKQRERDREIEREAEKVKRRQQEDEERRVARERHDRERERNERRMRSRSRSPRRRRSGSCSKRRSRSRDRRRRSRSRDDRRRSDADRGGHQRSRSKQRSSSKTGGGTDSKRRSDSKSGGGRSESKRRSGSKGRDSKGSSVSKRRSRSRNRDSKRRSRSRNRSGKRSRSRSRNGSDRHHRSSPGHKSRSPRDEGKKNKEDRKGSSDKSTKESNDIDKMATGDAGADSAELKKSNDRHGDGEEKMEQDQGSSSSINNNHPNDS